MKSNIFTNWRRSSRSSGTGNCVEVAVAVRPPADDTVAGHAGTGRAGCGRGLGAVTGVERLVGVRDSKDPDGAVLDFTSEAWRAFLADARACGFDLR